MLHSSAVMMRGIIVGRDQALGASLVAAHREGDADAAEAVGLGAALRIAFTQARIAASR